MDILARVWDYKGCEKESQEKSIYLTQNVKAKITNHTTKATTAHFLFPVKLAYANEKVDINSGMKFNAVMVHSPQLPVKNCQKRKLFEQ